MYEKNQMKVKRNLLLCSWLSFFLLISVLPGNASVFAQQEKLALSSTQLTVREIFRCYFLPNCVMMYSTMANNSTSTGK